MARRTGVRRPLNGDGDGEGDAGGLDGVETFSPLVGDGADSAGCDGGWEDLSGPSLVEAANDSTVGAGCGSGSYVDEQAGEWRNDGAVAELSSDADSVSAVATLHVCEGLAVTAWSAVPVYEFPRTGRCCGGGELRGDPGVDRGGDGGRGAESHDSRLRKVSRDSAEDLNTGASAGTVAGPASPITSRGGALGETRLGRPAELPCRLLSARERMVPGRATRSCNF